MVLYHSNAEPLDAPPDNLTVPQFFLDGLGTHPTRPDRTADLPCLIDEETGRVVFLHELRSRTDALSRAMKSYWHIGEEDVGQAAHSFYPLLVSLYPSFTLFSQSYRYMHCILVVSVNHQHEADYAVCVWATHKLGGIVSMMSSSLTAEELVYQLQIAKPVLLIAHSDNYLVALEAASSIGLSHSQVCIIDLHRSAEEMNKQTLSKVIREGYDLPAISELQLGPGQAKCKTALLCFSSGTTGEPKAVALSHYNIICNVVQAATFNRINEAYTSWEDRRFRPGDICTAVLPLSHIYGFVTNLHFMLYAAMTVLVIRKFNYEELLKDIARYRVTHLMIVPPQAVLFCKHPATKNYDLSSVRYCMVAAAPMTAELTTQLLSVFPNIHLGQGYGMTETCAAVSMFPVSQKVGTLGSGGQLVSGTVAKVVKADGTLANVNEPGELYVQGGQVAMGYYQNEAAMKDVFVDGWLRTGDEVIFRDNGDLFITDRMKELIKVKGFQVAPAELEGHLLDHPDVVDAGVVGVADDFAGEVPLAFVVLRTEVAVAAKQSELVAANVRASISNHVATTKSKHKWLAGGVVFIDAIPKSGSGKILRRILREYAKAIPTPLSKL